MPLRALADAAKLAHLKVDSNVDRLEPKSSLSVLRASKENFFRLKEHYTEQQKAQYFLENLIRTEEREPLSVLDDVETLERKHRDLEEACAMHKMARATASRLRSEIAAAARDLEASRADAATLREELSKALERLKEEDQGCELAKEKAREALSASRAFPVSVSEAEAEKAEAQVVHEANRSRNEVLQAELRSMEAIEAETSSRLSCLRSAAEERRRDALSGAQQVARMANWYEGQTSLLEAVSGVKVLDATPALIRVSVMTPGSRGEHVLSVILAPTEGVAPRAAGTEAMELGGRRATSLWEHMSPIGAELVPPTIAVSPIVDDALSRMRGSAAVSAIVQTVVARLTCE
jgi:hypothetical protein